MKYFEHYVARYTGEEFWWVVSREGRTESLYDRYNRFEDAYKMAKAFNMGEEPRVVDHHNK